MLRGLSNQDNITKNLIQQNDVEKLGAVKRNPYSNIDKNLLIDETSISNEAMNLYQRDLDIKKFSALAMSDPEDFSHNSLVIENIFGKQDESFENKIIEGIFESKAFLKDLFS